ncbi:MAG: hypothetical protein OXU75_15615 [Deltaproteobacteria bacterium]|nr:hypothetical protein [Deltaproteobacteria bacterium]
MPEGTEDRVTKLETAFETILPHLATKADLAKLETDLVKAIGKLESKMMWGALGLFVGMATIIVKLFT